MSEPVGFPGHSPYQLRLPGDIIVLAHRLPAASLSYRLNEAGTWSKNILVDEVVGVYPSLVNLRDGSALVIYYEEGEGSGIRARRFRLNRKGFSWLTF